MVPERHGLGRDGQRTIHASFLLQTCPWASGFPTSWDLPRDPSAWTAPGIFLVPLLLLYSGTYQPPRSTMGGRGERCSLIVMS